MDPDSTSGSPPDDPETPRLSDHAMAAFGGLQDLGIQTLKLTWILNGGAAITLLAFIGNLADKNISTEPFVFPMLIFCVGVFFGAVGHLLSYLMQLDLFERLRDHSKDFGPHKVWLRCAMAAVIVSVLCFGIGATRSAIVFGTITQESTAQFPISSTA